MQSPASHRSKLPFKSRMLVVSLACASLLLTLILLLFHANYISTELAIWASIGVFIGAALYESFLFSLITRHMLNKINKNSD